jgi:hypothetical protein
MVRSQVVSLEFFIDIIDDMALGSTQPLTEMSTRRIFLGVKCGRSVSLTTLPPSCAVVTNSGNLNFLEPSGPLQAWFLVLVGKPEGKRPLGRPRRRWEDNNKMDLQEVGWDKDWIDLAQDRDRWRFVVNAVINLRVP